MWKLYLHLSTCQFLQAEKESAILMQSKNYKREVTNKGIALLFGFRYLKVVFRVTWIRVYDNTEEKILQRSIFVECKTDLGRKETTSQQQVTNSTIIKSMFCRSTYSSGELFGFF